MVSPAVHSRSILGWVKPQNRSHRDPLAFRLETNLARPACDRWYKLSKESRRQHPTFGAKTMIRQFHAHSLMVLVAACALLAPLSCLGHRLPGSHEGPGCERLLDRVALPGIRLECNPDDVRYAATTGRQLSAARTLTDQCSFLRSWLQNIQFRQRSFELWVCLRR